MDNNINKTDRFFRERLSFYEEIPEDQVWDKIVSRLEAQKRRKAIFLFLRIAAGMTLLLSLGLGYNLIRKTDTHKAAVVLSKPTNAEKLHIVAPTMDNTATGLNNQSDVVDGNAPDTISKILPQEEKNTYIYNSYSDNSEMKTRALSEMSMHESPLLPVSAPHKLGYRRLSREEMLERTAALTADITENAVDEEKEDRWMLGSEVAPLFSYRKIESDYLNKSALQNMNNSEQGLMAYAGGVRVGYSAGRRLSVQSGLYYSRYGQEKNNGEAFLMDEVAYFEEPNVTYLSIPNSTGTIRANENNTSRYQRIINSTNGNKEDFYTNSGFPAITDKLPITEGDITAVQYFDYLEWPVTVKYKIIDRKLSFSVLGGVITNFLVNNSVKLKQDGNVEDFGTTGDISKVNYQGSVGLGVDYPLMDRLAISVEPRFRYYLNPIFDQKFNVHPYSFGIFAGISYTLK